MVSGHLREKRGYFHIILTYTDYDGQKRQKSISTGLPVQNNKRRAENLLQEARRTFEPPKAPKERMLFTEYLTEWLEEVKLTVREITYGSYESYTRKIREYFTPMNLMLCEINHTHIETFYKYLRQTKGLTANTVKHYHAVFSRAFKSAKKKRLIEVNPILDVELPKIEKFTGGFYNVDEVRELLTAVEGYQIELGVKLAVFYGLRRSEIVGLKWDSIDFNQKTIAIKHTVTQTTVKGEYKMIHHDGAKNNSSIRTLPLVPEFEEILLDRKNQELENKRLCGNCYNYEFDGYVYVDSMGELIKPNYLTQNFGIVLKNHGLRKIRFHDLRHSCASLLLAKGIPLKEIQEWLGHSNFSTTANIYAHLEKDSKQNSAQAMQNLGIGFSKTAETEIS